MGPLLSTRPGTARAERPALAEPHAAPAISTAKGISRPVRILVAGPIGAGKSTLAGELSARMGIPYAEIDSLYHGPRWTKRTEFRADVEALTSLPEWITEWQYDEVRPLLAGRANLFIWLDLPLPLVMYRVTKRTLRRWVRRERLWAGNREQPPWKILWDRSNMIRWSFVSRNHVPRAIPHLLAEYPNLRVVRLRGRHQVRALSALLASLSV